MGSWSAPHPHGISSPESTSIKSIMESSLMRVLICLRGKSKLLPDTHTLESIPSSPWLEVREELLWTPLIKYPGVQIIALVRLSVSSWPFCDSLNIGIARIRSDDHPPWRMKHNPRTNHTPCLDFLSHVLQQELGALLTQMINDRSWGRKILNLRHSSHADILTCITYILLHGHHLGIMKRDIPSCGSTTLSRARDRRRTTLQGTRPWDLIQ